MKKLLCILLALVMCVGLLPTAALAAEAGGLDNFKQAQTYTNGQFTDVKEADWFYKNIVSVYGLELMVGRGEGLFAPNELMTAAEAMTIAARLHSIYYTGKAEFTQGTPWYQVYSDYCKANGICNPADYDLTKPITRGQFADMFAHAFPADALKKINTVQNNAIPDVKTTDKFGAAIYLLYRAGVLVGNDAKGTFAPNSNIKRMEVAAITTRMADTSLRESIKLVKPSSDDGYIPYVPTYTVTFDLNGITGTAPQAQTIKNGEKATEPTPAPTDTDHTFGGWYKTKDATTGLLSDPWDFDNDTVTADMTLYAKWGITLGDLMAKQANFPSTPDGSWKSDYDIEFVMCYCTFGDKTGLFGMVVEGDPSLLLVTSTDELTKVTGGYRYLLPNGKILTFNMVGDTITSIVHTDIGTYEPVPTYTVTFDLNGVGSTIDPQTIASGSKVTKPDDPTDTDTVHTFGGWYKDEALTEEWDFASDTVTKDTTVYAKWTRTITSVLSTVDGGAFPFTADSQAPAGAWQNENGDKCWNGEYSGYQLVFGTDSPVSYVPVMLELTKSGDTYAISGFLGRVAELIFHMTDGKLTSIEYSDETPDYAQYSGTYTAPTFRAVFDSISGALTFYYDAVDHSGEGITVYEGTGLFNTEETTAQKKWGYNNNRSSIKSVVIDASVAGYKGLTSTAYMFQGMTAASDISGAEYLDVSNVTDMSFMFNNFGGGSSGNLTTLNVVPDVSDWNTGNVTNMIGMFAYYGNNSNLDKVPDVSGWNTGKVTDMSLMFQKYGHESQNFNAVPDVSNWDTGNVTNMANMFYEYGHKSTVLGTVPDVSNWNTDKVENMQQMFYGYGGASKNISCVLDLSGWDLSKITETHGEKVFNFNPSTFKVTIPAKTGEQANNPTHWYYGDGTNYIAPPEGNTFTFLPAGALKGVFSVSATKKVHFSQGNLVATIDATGAPTAWKFAANQYEYIGANVANTKIGKEAGDVDFFGWSTDASSNNWGIHTKIKATKDFTTGNFKDWGKAVGDGNTWCTLSKAEWTYLFNNHSKKWATVNGVKGYVIAPDGFAGTLSDTYADDAALAANNLVFLPAAGDRAASSVTVVGSDGFYWSSSKSGDEEAYDLHFTSSSVKPNRTDNRCIGCSVRLVTNG